MAHKPLIFETAFETYRTTGVIGEGGAGRVYSATNNAGEEFALKSLLPERVNAERLRRFKNEIQFCQRHGHQNIVRVVDHGAVTIKDTKCPFYVMKRYPGTLRTLLPAVKSGDVLPQFAQILDGVDAAHKLKVWHRDLKPENVLWSQNDRRLVVADFGIAHFEEEEIYTAVETKVASRLANFLYSAPEQRTRGAPVDWHADIFALGLMLNEMFTREVLQGSGYRRIADVAPDHAYLDDLVTQMTQHDQAKRPPIEDVKKQLIGRKAAFVALQKLDEAKSAVVPANTPPHFIPIQITHLDYQQGDLVFHLSAPPPSGWKEEFNNPSSSISYMFNYPPNVWRVDRDTIQVRPGNQSDKTMQELANYAKQWVDRANLAYTRGLQERAQREDREKRKELEEQVAAAEMRERILKTIKL